MRKGVINGQRYYYQNRLHWLEFEKLKSFKIG